MWQVWLCETELDCWLCGRFGYVKLWAWLLDMWQVWFCGHVWLWCWLCGTLGHVDMCDCVGVAYVIDLAMWTCVIVMVLAMWQVWLCGPCQSWWPGQGTGSVWKEAGRGGDQGGTSSSQRRLHRKDSQWTTTGKISVSGSLLSCVKRNITQSFVWCMTVVGVCFFLQFTQHLLKVCCSFAWVVSTIELCLFSVCSTGSSSEFWDVSTVFIWIAASTWINCSLRIPPFCKIDNLKLKNCIDKLFTWHGCWLHGWVENPSTKKNKGKLYDLHLIGWDN